MLKKKILFTFFAICILHILPLIFAPHLILHYKTITLITAAAFLWLSQPAFSNTEMQSNKSSDKFSILFILIMSSLSVFSSVWEWGYFTSNKSLTNAITITGLIFLIAGICIRISAIQTLGKNFKATVTVSKNQSLVTTGLYKYIRHPSYLGAFIAITGCPLSLNNTVTSITSPLLMLIAYRYRVAVEEQKMISHFGEEYKNYCKHTYRMFPFIW